MVLREDVAAVQSVADAAAAEQQEGHEQRMEQHQQVTSICFLCYHPCMLVSVITHACLTSHCNTGLCIWALPYLVYAHLFSSHLQPICLLFQQDC